MESTSSQGRHAVVGTVKPKTKQQTRQMLSCSKCRERKVKCDRTKPCSACCARGHPKECVFSVGDSEDFRPIQQGIELRRLRAENLRLKQQLLDAEIVPLGEDSDGDSPGNPWSASFRGAVGKLSHDEHGDTVYFGSPGIANVAEELEAAATASAPRNLTHVGSMGSATDNPLFGGCLELIIAWSPDEWTTKLQQCLIQDWEETQDIMRTHVVREHSLQFQSVLERVLTQSVVQGFKNNFEATMAKYPDILGFWTATLAMELTKRIWESTEQTRPRAQTKPGFFFAATMHLLRRESFGKHPTVISTQNLLLVSDMSAIRGHFMDAWTLMSMVIRMAQAVGLHCHPKVINPVPSRDEAEQRKRLWWRILWYDQVWAMLLGRPLAASSVGTCPLPDYADADATNKRVLDVINQLTIVGRQILAAPLTTTSRVKSMIEAINLLLDSLPQGVGFDQSWIVDPSNAPEHPLDETSATIFGVCNGYLLSLGQQLVRLENSRDSPSPPSSPASDLTSLSDAWRLVIRACINIIDILRYYSEHKPSALIGWTARFQAFNAAKVLLATQRLGIYRDDQYVCAVLDIFRAASWYRLDPFCTNCVRLLEVEIMANSTGSRHNSLSGSGGVSPPGPMGLMV